MKNLNIGIVGLGTVGKSVIENLRSNKNIISKRCLLNINLLAVSAKNKNKERSIDISDLLWVEDPMKLASMQNIDLVIELIGGESGIAYELAKEALKNGKHFVTANKAMIAKHGYELSSISEKSGAILSFEAAVAGGIPSLRTIKDGISANNISSVYGILNGTCNYILTQMTNKGTSFKASLDEAKKLGYAESNPTDDIAGFDTASKLSILSSLSFGCRSEFNNFYIEGIEKVNAIDIKMANLLGFNIVLLGIASYESNTLSQRVHPCMISKDSILSKAKGVLNTLVVDTDLTGSIILVGKGAGGNPTSSSVISDIIEIAKGNKNLPYGINVFELSTPEVNDFSKRQGRFYIRTMVKDEAGVVADISACFKEAGVSISDLLQRENQAIEGDNIPIIITTHLSTESSIRNALVKIASLKQVLEEPALIRIEDL